MGHSPSRTGRHSALWKRREIWSHVFILHEAGPCFLTTMAKEKKGRAAFKGNVFNLFCCYENVAMVPFNNFPNASLNTSVCLRSTLLSVPVSPCFSGSWSSKEDFLLSDTEDGHSLPTGPPPAQQLHCVGCRGCLCYPGTNA